MKKNILIISQSDPFVNAGVAALDLYNTFELGNYNTLILSEYCNVKNNSCNIVSYHNKYSWKLKIFKNKIISKFTKKSYNNKYYFDGSDYSKTLNSTNSLIKRLKGFTPDFIIIMFNHNFLSSNNIRELFNFYNIPIYLYLMDMKPFTGGCAYSWECNSYTLNCGNCPAIYSSNPRDITFYNLSFSKFQFSKVDIRLILASDQLKLEVDKSSLFKDSPKYKIYLGIDQFAFKPLNSESELNVKRDKFGIKKGNRVLFIGAVNLIDERKGLVYLLKALKILGENNCNIYERITILIASNNSEKLNEELLSISEQRIQLINFSYKKNVRDLVEIFNISDFFVSTSIVDAGPMMVNQSLICGTPVISFNIGIARDLVINNITGYKSEISVAALSSLLDKSINISNNELKILKSNCREFAITNFSYNTNLIKFQHILNFKRDV